MATYSAETWIPNHGTEPARIILRGSGSGRCGQPVSEWKRLAEERIAVPGAENLNGFQAAIRRNRLISKAYAELYLSDPDTFKWAGMAAFASRLVGTGLFRSGALRLSQDLKFSIWFPLFSAPLGMLAVPCLVDPFGIQLHSAAKALGLSDLDAGRLFLLLSAGNHAVFRDIYWQHLAYGCGLEELALQERLGHLPDAVFQGWKSIDEGRIQRDEEKIWRGSVALLIHEQSAVLQGPVYDAAPELWKQIGSIRIMDSTPSPIPGDPVSFRDFSPEGRFDRYEDRMRWIQESMLMRWRRMDREDRPQVLAEMRNIASEADSH